MTNQDKKDNFDVLKGFGEGAFGIDSNGIFKIVNGVKIYEQCEQG